ncbi:MAG TPA: hypothetical protein VGC62_20350 [Pseudomonas sp.]|uniref:hypothetical protein n=1 Tax=Pseudomonas sp. TaxID=306 RepID=UPI002EDB7ECA
MSNYLEMEAHRRSYLPVCACNIVIACLSVAFALWIVVATYLTEFSISAGERFLVVSGFSCAAIVFHCNFMITGGRGLWLKVSIGILILCLLIVVPAMGYQPNFLVYAFAISFPLLGLLSFNSNRHRQFYIEFREFRRQRASVHQYGGGEVGRFAIDVNSNVRRKNKISKREIAINNRLRDQAEKAAALDSEGLVIRRFFYLFLLVFLTSAIGYWCYLIYAGLVSEVVAETHRFIRQRNYSAVNDFGLYWLTMFFHLLAVGLFAVVLKLVLLLRKLDSGKYP